MTNRKQMIRFTTLIGFFVTMANAATTNTWDAVIGTPGAQDGDGTWSTSAADSNWWNNASANTNWSNSAVPDLTVIGAGSGAAGTLTLGENITVGHLWFNAAGSGSYTLDGNGNTLGFGFNYPLLWVSKNVTVTNRINSSSSAINLNVTGGGTFVFAGTNTLKSVDMMDAQTTWFGITGGVAGTTFTIPPGAMFKTVGFPPNYQYSTFGFRLRDQATLNVDGNLTTSARIGGHSGESDFAININPGAVVTNLSDVLLGWNSKATMNMNGGYVNAYAVSHLDNETGTLNLNGGALEVDAVNLSAGSGAFHVNFNGGLLIARNSTLFNETSTKNNISTYFVKDGGVRIDGNGKNIEALPPFRRSGSGGLNKYGAGTMSFSGGSYTGATTVAGGTLNLNFNRRASWAAAARQVISDFHDRTSRLVLNGGAFAVTGRATVPSVTRTFTLGKLGAGYGRGARSGNTSGLVAGMTVSGTYIPNDTFVTYVNSSGIATISKESTFTNDLAMSLTFGGVTNATWQMIDSIELLQNATLTVNANNGPGTVLSVGAITGPGGLTKDGDGILALYGTNTYAGATLIQNGTVKLTAPVVVSNASFEVHAPLPEHPPYGFYADAPANTYWSYSSAGIAALGCTWVSSNAIIDGASAAFIKTSESVGKISTALSLSSDGQYVISFMAGKRPVTPASAIIIDVDGTDLCQFAAAEFTEIGDIYSGTAYLTAGTHTLTFKGILTGVDTATWVDRVSLSSLADGNTGDNLLPTGTTVTVASGAVLDLGGSAQSVAAMGGSGLVTNGTLTVTGTVLPGNLNTIGTLTLATDAILSGSLLIDTSLDGTNDQLKVQGTLDLTGATLQIQDVDALNSSKSYVIATCAPGGLTGRFASINVDEGRRWHVVYDNMKGEVRLELILGMIIQIH